VDETEAIYLAGRRAAWRSVLHHAIRELGYKDDWFTSPARMIAEREDAIAALREVCGEHGDNDWPNDLRLADIIEKHLATHLG
jgi:hypothetical protein